MTTITNGESGLSVRNKINEAINKVDGAAPISSINIDGGTIDGVVIGGTTPGAITGTTGQFDSITATSGDIDGGTIDGVVIGGTTPGAITGTTGQFDSITATSGDIGLSSLDLTAIAETKAVTAVDVFVYDTSKDSDGGAWRKRTQHTSWYNETLNTATRGSRREFPAVAVIVLEANRLTIYDGDDPALPMWMVFISVASDSNAEFLNYMVSGLKSVFMLNGVLVTGGTRTDSAFYNHLREAHFVADKMAIRQGFYNRYYTSPVGISMRNNNVGFAPTNSGGVSGRGLVDGRINDVAMTVLPDAPTDPATGLPVPTIAVATDGGVSVIKDDGTVVDATITSGRNYVSSIEFLEGGSLFALTSNVANPEGWFAVSFEVPDTDITDVGGATGYFYSALSVPAVSDVNFADIGSLSSSDSVFLGRTGDVYGSGGLTLLKEGTADKSKGMVAYTTSTYNTGWMPGDIKGAFLSDTDDTDLVGSGELVTNGTFDSDVSGWTALGVDGGTDTTFSWNASEYMEVTRGVGSTAGRPEQGFTTVVGETYTISVDVVTAQRAFWIVGSVSGSNNLAGTVIHVGNTTVTRTFVATSTTSYVSFWTDNSTTTGIDNISVKLVDRDRSVNNNPLIVNGTITRTPVATGSDLVAYSGFSSSNYLEQPYNSDLDFGTGDFSIMGWMPNFAGVGSATGFIGRRIDGATATGRFLPRLNSDKTITLYKNSGSIPLSTPIPSGDAFLAFVRRNGVLEYYINGQLTQSTAMTDTLTSSGATLNIGYPNTGWEAFPGSLALWRISATAPTAEQIAKIYNDEKVLFQENVACTLYGASDAVTALAHDPVTDLLHVGTSAGRSVFSGLRRVSNTTTAVGTAISASGGLVVEE